MADLGILAIHSVDLDAARRVTGPLGLEPYRQGRKRGALILGAFSSGEVWVAVLLKRRRLVRPAPLYLWHRLAADVVMQPTGSGVRLKAACDDTFVLALRARPPRRLPKWTGARQAYEVDAHGRLGEITLTLSGRSRRLRRGALLELGDHPIAQELKQMRLSLRPREMRYVEEVAISPSPATTGQ